MKRLPLFSILLFVACLFLSLDCQDNNATSSPVPKSQPPKPSTEAEAERPAQEAPKPAVAPEGWSNLEALIPDAVFDIRYATKNNFVGEQLYPCPTCWLRPDAAKAVASAADKLRKKGYRVLLFDCYRPLPIQERLWEIKPDATYVTPPSRGSMHNRGLAVDIGLADQAGTELNMGTPFDYFGRPAHQDFTGHPPEIQARRDLLKNTMIEVGFGPIRSEWWHYSFRNSKGALSRDQWPCPEADN